MFLQNKYTKWYHQIIQNAKSRIVDGYTESHHIIPKSLGGTNDKTNLVNLTAREHLICHMLLPKMVLGNSYHKMINALWAMGKLKNRYHQRAPITSKVYEKLKKDRSAALSKMYKRDNNPFYGKTHSEDTKEKMKGRVVSDTTKELISVQQKERFANQSGTFLGKTHSANTRKKMSESASKPKSDAWKLSASKNRKGKIPPNRGKSLEEIYGKERANQIKEKQRHIGTDNGFYGKHHTAEQRAKKSKEKLESPKKICYYCNKQVDAMNYGRWHGDKCKQRI